MNKTIQSTTSDKAETHAPALSQNALAHLPPKGLLVTLTPSRVQGMMSGVEKITQDFRGKVTLHYEGGQTESVQMSELNVEQSQNFLETFRLIWKRIEFGA